MKYIESGFSLEAFPGLGLLHHPRLGEVIIWRQHEFHTWWNLYESLMQHPLSRTFVNAFVDSLEINHTLTPTRGLFRKKKFHIEMNLMSSLLGWGRVEFDERRVIQGAHSLLSVALGQYAIETFDQHRYKVRWLEPSSQTVQLELERTTDLPPPQPHNPFPWSRKSVSSKSIHSQMVIEDHEGCELRVEGERVVLIPIMALERFLSACLPYAPESNDEWFHHQIESFSAFENLFKTTIKSIAAMFLKSEQPVYILDRSSWDSYIEHYLIERGWGAIEIMEYDASSFELNCSIQSGASFPFTLGMICGMWERAHGRAYRINLRQKDTTFLIKIESFLEYQNHE